MNKKIIAFIFLCTLLATASIMINAAVITDDNTSSVTVSGKVESGKDNVNIGIDVFCPNMNYSDALTVPTDEFARVFAYRGQTKSGNNGEWTLTFKIDDNPEWDYDAKSGEYTAVISPADDTPSYNEKFLFINLKETEKAIEELKSASDDDFLRVLEEEKYALGIDYDFFETTDKSKVKDILKSEIASGSLSDTTLSESINVIRKAVLIQGLNEGKLNNLFDYKDILELDKTEISQFIEKAYIKLNEKGITAALKGKEILSFSDFEKKLVEATVLTVVKNPDGEANVKEITEAFAGKIGFNAPLNESAYRAVMGHSYATLETLRTALEKANTSGTQEGSSNGSGGGGTVSVTVPAPLQSVAQPMEYDIFTDLENVSWAKDAIVYLAQKGIVNGKTETLFFPDDSIKREEAAKILVLSFAPDAKEADIMFTDVNKDAWYYTYIAKAVNAGISSGYSDTQFGVGDNISRQDMVTMIYRAAVKNGIVLQTDQIGFADENEIADYAKEAVGALTKTGIVSGVDFNSFAPKAWATRVQMAKIIYRLLEL